MSSFFGFSKSQPFVNDVPPRPKDLPVWRHDGVDDRMLKSVIAAEAARLQVSNPKLTTKEYEMKMNAFKAGVWAGYGATLKIHFNEIDPEVIIDSN